MRFIYAQRRVRNPRIVAHNDNMPDFGMPMPIPGFPDTFRATSHGEILKGNRRLKGFLNDKGYRRVMIRRDGRDSNHYVHALVAAAFLGPRPAGWHVDHINFDKSDNRPENLRYMSAEENSLRRRCRSRKGDLA